MIKTFVQRHVAHRLRPVAFAPRAGEVHAQVPFADHRRGVPLPA